MGQATLKSNDLINEQVKLNRNQSMNNIVTYKVISNKFLRGHNSIPVLEIQSALTETVQVPKSAHLPHKKQLKAQGDY